MTPTAQNIADQRERLADHRQNVQTLLKQIAGYGGFIHAPLEKLNTLRDQRAEIVRCKATLRSWGQVVEDHADDDAAGNRSTLEQEIGELERSGADQPATLRRLVEQALASAPERREALKPVQATVNVGGDARVGIVVGVNLGTVIYGRDPSEDECKRLVWYLEGLVAKLGVLPLRGLSKHLHQGEGLVMPRVYTALATRSRVVLAEGSVEQLKGYFQGKAFESPLVSLHHLDHALPDQAVLQVLPDAQRKQGTLVRALLASEVVHRKPRLVLLGDPGAGKSTFVRHLAWTLAQRILEPAQATALLGWEDRRELLPVVLSLRKLAAQLARDGASEATGYAALCDELHACCTHQIDDALSEALSRGAALLLFDGLDEVPVESGLGVADRLTTLRAVRELVRRYGKCLAVLTCRTRAFDDTLRAELGWHVETLAPFTLGQIRHFVSVWHAELVVKGQLDQDQAGRLGQTLLGAISDPNRPRLREMAQTPLLLTLMALVLFDQGQLPRDRPQLYEQVLDLLLGQWDQVREGQSLGEVLGLPGWDSSYIRPLLDRLSYEAHAAASSEDGRGRLARGTLYTALIDFFKQARVERPGDVALRCLDYMEQRSGLLMPDGPDSFVFAHLTLQEHCAGRQLVLNTDDPVSEVLRHRGDDRWREPLFLGLGLAPPGNLDRLLFELVDREEQDQLKRIGHWYRDLILAAEIGVDRDWTYLRTRPMVRVLKLQQVLRRDLALLLANQDQPLPVRERVRAGFLLGGLGDERFPVSIEQWRGELDKLRAGDTSGYFCRVEPDMYWIGSADDDLEANESEKPRHAVTFKAPFWIGKYPITNAQWQAWVEVGGPLLQSVNDTTVNHPNQPVVNITWNEAMNFCVWLSEQLGVEVRLPSEAEWEAAARGREGRRYPWGNEWVEDRAATGNDWEVRGGHHIVPVGCYPAGAAGCGAFDLTGNVLEWMLDVLQSYPGAKESFFDEDYRGLRGGGSHRDGRVYARCGSRRGFHRVNRSKSWGFRVVTVVQM